VLWAIAFLGFLVGFMAGFAEAGFSLPATPGAAAIGFLTGWGIAFRTRLP
jgi:hypothetical protein